MSQTPLFAEWAPKYAAKGIFVFPVLRGGKEPLTPRGFHDASTDPEQIARWCKQFPEANIGIATGASNLVVLDIDPKHNGDESFEKLAEEIPALRETLTARTGTGGRHVYMNARETVTLRNSAGRLNEGLDIRADGGYVVAPPSINKDGNPYVWENLATPRIDVPLELVGKLEVEKWTPVHVEDGQKVPDGRRNEFLWKQACSLRAKGWELETIYAAVSALNQAHCQPPGDEDKVQDICERAAQYPPGEALALAKRSSEHQREGRKKFKVTKYDAIKPEDMEWLMPGYIAKGKFNLGWGLEGRGKSYATIGIAAAISRGEPLPGSLMPMGLKPRNTLLLTYEDDPNDTIAPRLIKCGADMSRIFTVHYNDGLVNAKDMAAFTETIMEIPELDLVVIDPLTAFATDIDENSMVAVTEAMQPIISLAMLRKFAILGIKHANKDENKSIANRVSGSRAWTSLARSVFLVGHDNEKENRQGETYGGMISTKGNFGIAKPITYRVLNGVFEFTGTDETLTPERLFPKPKAKDE